MPSRSTLTLALSLLMAAVLHAEATVVVKIDAQRGTQSGGGVSWGAYTATDESFSFQGLVWSGDASALWSFHDSILPGVLSEPTVLTMANLGSAPFLASLPLGGGAYVRHGGSGVFTTPPLYFIEQPTSSSLTLTPAGTKTSLSGTSAGNVIGGGTYTLTIGGTLAGANDPDPWVVSLAAVLSLSGVDATAWGAENVLVSTRLTGMVVPEPGLMGWMAVIGSLFLLLGKKEKRDRVGATTLPRFSKSRKTS